MTIPPKVIELAISGGWDSFFSQGFTFNSRGLFDVDTDFTSYEEIALDPTFWQALGKALGWSEYAVCNIHGQPCTLNCTQAFPFEYMYQAHRFYDLILTQQPTDTFWEEIISSVK